MKSRQVCKLGCNDRPRIKKNEGNENLSAVAAFALTQLRTLGVG
jgi:hypothetical protein